MIPVNIVSKDKHKTMKKNMKIIKSIQKGLDDVRNDKVKPIDTLWDELKPK